MEITVYAFYLVRTHRQWRDASKVQSYLDLCRKLVSRAAVRRATPVR